MECHFSTEEEKRLSVGKQAALDRKLFTVGSQQRLGGAFAQFGGSRSENRAPEWLEVFPASSASAPATQSPPSYLNESSIFTR
jgi:hypothetical protein